MIPSSEIGPRRVVVLASSPENTGVLRTDIEIREIEDGLRAARRRELFVLEKRVAVRPRDLQRVLMEFEPEIVHFCGHGSRAGGLLLENDSGYVQEVPPDALADLFRLFTGKVHCVLLNACYSEIQAGAISKYVPYVIGMHDTVDDFAARRFAIGFYDALGAGRPFEFAFEIACNALRLEKLSDQNTPVLKKNGDIFASQASTTSYAALQRMSQADLAERSEALRAGLRLFPEKWLHHLDLGLIHLYCKNYDESLLQLKHARDLAPAVADTHYYYALACFRGRQPQMLTAAAAVEIESHLKRALDIGPKRSMYFYLWAILKCEFMFRNNIPSGPPAYDELFRRARELSHEPEEIDRVLQAVPLIDGRLVSILQREDELQ